MFQLVTKESRKLICQSKNRQVNFSSIVIMVTLLPQESKKVSVENHHFFSVKEICDVGLAFWFRGLVD